jgi:hypothetical protein
MLIAEGTNRYLHRLKKGLTAILQIFVGTLPLSADPGKVIFKNSIMMQSFRHRRRQRCATSRYCQDLNRELLCCYGTLIQ